MRQKIQRLLLFSVGMSSLVLVSEPMIPSIQPALAAAGQDTVTVRQNNSHEKSQNPGQIDRKVITQKNELARATAPSHRLIGRTPSSFEIPQQEQKNLDLVRLVISFRKQGY